MNQSESQLENEFFYNILDCEQENSLIINFNEQENKENEFSP